VQPTQETQHRVVSYIPHWESATYWDWPATCTAAGLEYVDPLQPVEAVIAQIRASRLVITEAMHGAISPIRSAFHGSRFTDTGMCWTGNGWIGASRSALPIGQ
jgi:hypothetical protein